MFMKRIINAHLTIPIEVDENGVINLLNEYTQTYITAFSGELKPRDNMYQKIMDFLKQETAVAVTHVASDVASNVASNVASTDEEDPVYMVLKKSGLHVRKRSNNQTFKTYGKTNGRSGNQWTRRL